MTENYWKEYRVLLHKAWTATPCEKCGAKVGEICLTASGNAVSSAHLKRNRRAHFSAKQQMQEREKKAKKTTA